LPSPIKILHYIPTYAPAWKFGGPVRSTSLLCEGLVREGNEVEVFTTDAGLEQEPEIPRGRPVDRGGVKATYFPRAPGMGIRCPDLEKAVRARVREFDLIHVTGVWQRTAPAAYRVALEAGVPLVVSPRGALSRYSWTQRRWRKLVYFILRERPALRRAAGIHYTSKLEQEESRPYRFRARTTVIANPVDTVFWARDPAGAERWRQQHGFSGADRIAFYAGRLEPKKNLNFLIPVLARASTWNLVFLGYNERGQVERLCREAARLGCGPRLRILPDARAEDLRSAYSAADVFVLPSHHENFANSAVEAVACGCPALLSGRVGCAEELQSRGWAEILPLETEAWVAAWGAIRPGRRIDPDGLGEVVSPKACARAMGEFYGKALNDFPSKGNR